MTNPYPPQQPYIPAAPPMPKPKKPKKWPWIVGIVVAFGLGAAVGSGGKTPAPAAAGPSSAVSVAPAGTKSAPAAPAPTTAAQAPAGPKTSFSDGTYKVGEDIEPGTYKSPGPRADSIVKNCYWARMKNDSGAFDAIIANNGGDGPARVTVKAGEYLQVSGCDFTKA